MIVKYPTITLHKGATSVVDFDLTDFDFQGGYVMLTIKDQFDKEIKTQRLDFQGINQVVFNDEFTATLNLGKAVYQYDLMWHLAEERYPQCLPSNIDVYKTIGGFQ